MLKIINNYHLCTPSRSIKTKYVHFCQILDNFLDFLIYKTPTRPEMKHLLYVQMLVQCFALSWKQFDKSTQHDHICEHCVSRLRKAINFKKTVLESQEIPPGCIDEDESNDPDVGYGEVEYLEIADITEQEASEEYNIPKPSICPNPKWESNETTVEIKIENVDESYQEYCENEASATASGYKDDPGDPDYVELDEPNDSDASNDMVYEEVEYLELEDNLAVPAVEQNPEKATTTTRLTQTAAVTPASRKRPQKLPRAEHYNTQVQHTKEDLQKCLEAVWTEVTQQEASEQYHIPKEIICEKLKLDPNDERDAALIERNDNKKKLQRLMKELTIILTYTNATPYKCKAHNFYCFYCPTDGPYFTESEKLRTHIRTEHVTERITKIEHALRPAWLNETVKLDIDNLICNVCCIALPTWNEMFRHLKEQHEIVLDIAYSRIIPFVLSDDHKCTLCKEEFRNYMQLNGHMNAHYDNYVCDVCGDTFLAANRLKQHKMIHYGGKYPCNFCSKVFSLEKYRKNHTDLVHKHTAKFKCWYCEDRFSAEYSRHLHAVEKHKEKLKVMTCEICGKSFTWRPYYLKHMRIKHGDDPKKYKCEVCDKKFFHPYVFKQHASKCRGRSS